MAEALLYRLDESRGEFEPCFTDEILDPTRTTRKADDPLAQVNAVVAGDELLVDITPYLPDAGWTWCSYIYSSHGSASVYPYNVQVPGRGVGQASAEQVRGWRRPVQRHRALREAYEAMDEEERVGRGLPPGPWPPPWPA